MSNDTKPEPQHNYYAASENSSDTDVRELVAIGKKPVLRRNFSPIAILGLACSSIITWEGMFSVFIFGLRNGGPTGLIYGFLLCWAGWAAVVATMSELASMWPTAGGQYHWTYMLAPERWKVFLSYLAGWQSVIAWQALLASSSYLSATTIQGLIVNSIPLYEPQRWHGTLMIFGLILICVIFNTYLSRWLPQVEIGIFIVHIILFVVVLVVITVMSPTKASNAQVWTAFASRGGYESKGLSFFVGLITPVFAFSGVDGTVHMSEEIRHSSKVVPWAMMTAIGINGLMGFSMLIVILYCIGDIDSALNSPTGYPFIYIMTQGTRSIPFGTALSGCLVAMFCFATLTLIATTSRQLWAFARDAAVPNARLVSSVHQRMKVPVVSIGISATMTCLLSLINIGSATVFNAIVSLTVAGFFGSYLIPLCLYLHKRVTQPSLVPPGPWTLGRWGAWVNGFAILWSVLVMFFSFWPSSVPVTAATMNWSCVLWSAAVAFAGVFWWVHGRRVYNGPIVETGEKASGIVGYA